MMDVQVIETSKGKKAICFDGFLYRYDKTLKSEDISWRCTDKNCTSRVRTDSSMATILSHKNEHNHSQDDRKIERHLLPALYHTRLYEWKLCTSSLHSSARKV